MKNFYLEVIEKQKGRPMYLVLSSLSAYRINYRVRTITPNVIEYEIEKFNIKGKLIF